MTVILITGATGFLGTNIVTELLKEEIQVRAVVRSESQNLPHGVQKIVVKDLFDASSDDLDLILNQVDIVVHCAWYVKHHDYLTSAKNFNAYMGTVLLAHAAKENNVKHFLGIGTCLEYGLNQKMPLTVQSDLSPKTIYGTAKLATYQSLQSIFKISNTKFTWCRVFNLYGENEKASRFHPYIHECLQRNELVTVHSGNLIRDYLPVTAAAKMIINAISTNILGPINISSGSPQKLSDIALAIAAQYGKEDLLNIRSTQPDDATPREIVGVPYNFAIL